MIAKKYCVTIVLKLKGGIVLDDNKTYYQIERNQLKNYRRSNSLQLTNQELQSLKALNDRVSLNDVAEVYGPILNVFELYYQKHIELHQKEQQLLQQPQRTIPFIVGISGSVAVGKSTTARLFQTLLEQKYPNKKIELMTTDGFLYPTKVLQAKGILDKKGFPESYDMERLIEFLISVKTENKPVTAPIYSHDIYDVLPNITQTIDSPDILIVEGINVLQLPPNLDIYVSDFFDWSIYVDAEAEMIEQWFLERFELILDKAKYQPENYYYQLANDDRQKAIEMAKNVWKTINLKNLHEYILPTRQRADLIIHKSENHYIDKVFLKKY